MTSRLGVQWSVMHRRPQDYSFFLQQQPAVFKIMDGGPPDYQWARDNLPNSLIVARSWSMSEQHEDMLKDPVGTGYRHAQEWAGHQQRLGFDKAKTLILGINEPRVWEPGVPEALRIYTIAMCDEATHLGLRVGAMQLSVGWPANNGPDTPPNWSPWHGIDNAIRHNNGALVLHEYWADLGPSENWGWWGGRALKCPWQVPIVIGETGVDMMVKYPDRGGNQRGWRENMPPERYASELADYTTRMSADSRFVGCAVFAADYASQDWWSFDIEPAYGAILSTPLPDVEPEPPQPPVEATTLYIRVEAGANMRAEPNTSSAIVTAVPFREAVKVSGMSVQPDGYAWAMSTYGIHEGWIRSDLLSLTKPPPPQPQPPDESLSLIWPVQGATITQRFGANPAYYLEKFGIVGGHNGVDFGTPSGTPIYAVADGVVAQVGDDPSGYGLFVELQHLDWRLTSLYAHCSEISVSVGQTVRQGQTIALVGSTGNTTGPHCHWELRAWDGAGYVNVSYGHSKGRQNCELTMWLLGQPPVYG